MRVLQFALGAAVCAALLTATAVAPPAARAANPEGVLDPSFDGDGKKTVLVGANTFGLGSVLQPDGKLVLVGESNTGITNVALLTRLTTSGALDTTFGGGTGSVTTPIGSNGGARAVALQSDGKIVVVAGGTVSGTTTGFVLRYTSTGVLDTSFSSDGVTTITQTGYATDLTDVAIQPDGKIVAVGYRYDTDTSMMVVRLTASGALDTTFNGTGVQTWDALGNAEARKVEILDDGRIVFAGTTYTGDDPSKIGVSRLTATGGRDLGFNGTGNLIVPLGSAAAAVEDLVIAPDGTIVLVGQYDNQAVVARLTGAGALDSSFAGDGSYNVVIGNGGSAGHAGALEPNGRLVVAGRAGLDMWVTRLLPIGVPDPTFGDAGLTVTSIAAVYDTPVGLGIGANGKITVGVNGQTESGNVFAAARFHGDKTPPFGARLTGLPRFSTALSRTLAWTASDDNTGVASYDIRYRSAASSSSTLGSATTWKSATTAPYGSFKGSAGRTYCFEARGRDAAANVGLYGKQACTAFPLNDRSLTRSGSWTSVSASSYYLGTASRSTSSGARLTRTSVRYRNLAIVATTCSSCGTVRVYLGSTLLKSVSLYSSSTKRKVVIAIDSSAAVKSGTVSIRQSSSGKPVIIEGLAVSLY